MTFYTLTQDADGHWIATCDRCSREIRTAKPHGNMSISGLAAMLDDLDVHQATHPAQTDAPVDDDELELGADDLVEPLPGALNDESDW